MSRPMHRMASLALLLAAWPSPGRADTPISVRGSWSGSVDFIATGAPLAIDGPDADSTDVDTLVDPATVTVPDARVPGAARLLAGYLYWAGSIGNSACAGSTIDDTVDFTPPGEAASTEVIADDCYCSDADATSYDIQVCRADVKGLIGTIAGNYSVGGFAARAHNDSTDNASFALVLVVEDRTLKPRRIALYDGVQTMYTATGAPQDQKVISLTGLQIDSPAEGSLAWYVLDGDVGGSGSEGVSVAGSPGGKSLALADAVNPATNPMNHSMNTASPPRSDTLGVDLDAFDISGALTPDDTAVEMTYSAGTDKYWIAFNIVGVDVYEAVFNAASKKEGFLLDDADGDLAPSEGDTVRYTIHLDNTGTAPGTVRVIDQIPSLAASWNLVDAAGGADESTADTLVVSSILLPVGESADVVFDMVIGPVSADETPLTNVASFDATPRGDSGLVTAPAINVRVDGDGDGTFDNDDNCPLVANRDQTDIDFDGIGDLCDECPGDPDNDADGDGLCGDVENCPEAFNPDQADADADGVGDVCDTCPLDRLNDADSDGVCQDVDNCPAVSNPDQADSDGDGVGDVCDGCADSATGDADGDGTCDDVDNCPGLANPGQADADGDGVGDACDSCKGDPLNDVDGDGVCGDVDNCPEVANADQADGDGDGVGDACSGCPDRDGDGSCDETDNCPDAPNADQSDRDGDFIGDVCDACADDARNDVDGDGICGDVDNCPEAPNPDQADADGDGTGDACGGCPDQDFDGVCDDQDTCPSQANLDQRDADGDGEGDVCDPCPEDPADDEDGDRVCGDVDNCPTVANPGQEDTNGDGTGDACLDKKKPGCNCQVGGGGGGDAGAGLAGLALLGVLAIAHIRWRRRPVRS